MPTALITGVSGQDGSYLADLLLDKGYRVVGILRRSSEYQRQNIRHLGGQVVFEYADLIDSAALNAIVAKYQPDEVYNFAAQSVPADSWAQPITTGEITALGVVRLLEAVRNYAPHAKFYQASSREIFGGVPQEVVTEDTPFLANNPYGTAKLFGHLMVQTYRASYHMFACGGILFNHESPRRALHFVTRKVTMAAACISLGVKEVPLDESGLPLVIEGKVTLGNLDAQRDWGYAKEYVEAAWLMLQQHEPRDYVIATNTSYSIRDLCRIAFDQVGLDWRNHVVSNQRFIRPTEINVAQGDYSRAKEELGWEPETTFEQLIKLMVKADLELLKSRQ